MVITTISLFLQRAINLFYLTLCKTIFKTFISTGLRLFYVDIITKFIGTYFLLDEWRNVVCFDFKDLLGINVHICARHALLLPSVTSTYTYLIIWQKYTTYIIIVLRTNIYSKTYDYMNQYKITKHESHNIFIQIIYSVS